MSVLTLPEDERWMARTLDLARRGEALASPNPLVGAVLVKNGKVVGDGFHEFEGLRHAEIIALEKAGSAARGATLYVNLEPCCHRGRTGPCSRALINARIKRAVVAMWDPNPAVAGSGMEELRAAGIEVVTGVAESEARRLNEAFAVWITSNRPMATLKTAMTLDGQMLLPPQTGKPRNRQNAWITSKASRDEVQRMRHASDAILTGIGTVLTDDPLLTDRTGLPRRRRLLRVVLDSGLRMPSRCKLIRNAKNDLLIFTRVGAPHEKARALADSGAAIVAIGERDGRLDLGAVLDELGRREILSLMLEPGPTLCQSALDAGIVDKVRMFYSPTLAGIPAARQKTALRTDGPLRNLSGLRIETFGPDFAIEGYLEPQ